MTITFDDLVKQLAAIVDERDRAALNDDDPAYLGIDREIEKARNLLDGLRPDIKRRTARIRQRLAKSGLYAILGLLWAYPAAAQTVTTTTFTLGGVVNCQSVSLIAQRVDTKTTVDMSIRQCRPGETIPTLSITSFVSPIPNGDFTVDKAGAHLRTASPYGPISIDWTITPDSRSSYDAAWTWQAPTNRRETQHDDFLSVHGVGSIGSYAVDRNGLSTVSVFRK